MTAEDPHLVVLGVAQDGGHPQAGCARPCCAHARTPGSRSGAPPGGEGHRVAALGVVDGPHRFLLDCTPDFPSQLRDLGGPPLDGIVLTHAHSGHYAGLLHLGPEAWAAPAIPVWVMPQMAAFLRGNAPWSALEPDGHVALRPLAAGLATPLTDRIAVVPLLVPHRGPWSETIAIRVEGPRAKVLFVPDIDRWQDWDRDPAEVIAQVDRAYVDGTFFDASEVPWRDSGSKILHPLVTDSLARFAALPAAERQKITFIHLNHTNPLLDPRSAAHQAVIDAGMRVARDGERFGL